MKTIIKALVIALTMTMSFAANAAKFRDTQAQYTICSDQDTMQMYAFGVRNRNTEYIARVNNSGRCSKIPGTAKFEILRYNDLVAEVVFYNNQGQLLKDQPVWVVMEVVDQRVLAEPLNSLVDQISGKKPAASAKVDADKATAFLQANVANPDRQMFDPEISNNTLVRCRTWDGFNDYMNQHKPDPAICVTGSAPNGFKILEQSDSVIIKIQMYTASGALDPNGVYYTSSTYLAEPETNESFQGD